jgi:branched-chain amino acid transport system permease protein
MDTIFDMLFIGLLRGGLYALMASGLTLVLGVMNISNFAHGELYMVGSYAAYFAGSVFGLHPLLAILVGALAASATGVLVERTAFRALRTMSRDKWLTNSFLLTVGISFILQYSAFVIWGPTYKGVPSYWEGFIPVTPTFRLPLDRAFAFMAAVVGVSALWFFLTKTVTGKAIRSVSEDETGAMLVGINIRKMHTLTFALSCLLAGLAGASLLPITPAQPFVGLGPLFKSYFVVILAGFGNVMGSVIGAFVIGLLETITYYNLGAGWQNVASLIVIMLVLLLKPAGLFGSE